MDGMKQIKKKIVSIRNVSGRRRRVWGLLFSRVHFRHKFL
jgi:hypothetical protein